MAFELKFSVDIGDCTELAITDTSGTYSAINPQNLTGWNSGLPDMPSISNVVTATLSITTKDTAIPYVINVFPTLPNITGAIYTVLPTQIGYTTSIPTQVLKMVYTVTGILPSGVPFTYTSWCLVGVLCNEECCVDRLNAEALTDIQCNCPSPCECTCPCSEKMMIWMKAFTLLYGLKKQIYQKLYNQAVYTLGVLKTLCQCN